MQNNKYDFLNEKIIILVIFCFLLFTLLVKAQTWPNAFININFIISSPNSFSEIIIVE
jgi:hypothetical protein